EALSRSSAAPTISLTFCQFSRCSIPTSLHFPRQPRLRHIPLPLDGRARTTQQLGYLFNSQATEESQFHNPRQLLIEFCERLKRIIQDCHLNLGPTRTNNRGVQLDLLFRPPLRCPVPAGMVDQHL